jgi:hypothetical protein
MLTSPVDREEADKVINTVVATLKLACESKIPRAMTKALDCLQKLMAHGFIRPSIRDTENPKVRLTDKIIEVIGDCFETTDDEVQLQIMKAFLTGVSSTQCDVHGHSLVNAIRGCFNIYLVSRSRDNQATAKATLTQMLGIIFQRFELAAAFAQEERDRASEQGYSMTVEVATVEPKPIVNEETEGQDPEMEDIFLEAIASDEKDEMVEAELVPPAPLAEEAAEGISEESTGSQEPGEAPRSLPNEGQRVHVATGQAAVNIAYTDCSVIFKALCKLSSKELPAS